jgi:hypothetical protein
MVGKIVYIYIHGSKCRFSQQSCATTFCEDACYAELANLHDDCINNPRANIDADDQQTILQLAPPQLLQLCSGPDSGTVAPPGGGGH